MARGQIFLVNDLKKYLTPLVSGNGVKARTSRTVIFTALQFGGSNLIRLGSNLILTRLLFPEAFGLMALVYVFLTGLNMFSDLGIKTSIVQNDRGDDADFLNTAWTLQIFRGFLLWLGACALAPLAAAIYDEPMLLMLLPVTGINVIIDGFTTTKVATGFRHLSVGRQAFVELGTQLISMALIVLFALLLRSVWALVIGTLISSMIRVYLFHRLLPGIRNRLHLERDAVGQLFGFGKFIFFSTIAGFMIGQGDKAVLGTFVSTETLGIYNIALVLGTLPVMMGHVITSRIMLPLYRMRPPQESAENQKKLQKTRRIMVAGILSATIAMAFGGLFVMDFLYDERYALAGPMVVLFSLASVPQVTFAAYDNALLAAGNSRRFFYVTSTRAIVQTVLLFIMINAFGISGAILAPAIAVLITLPQLRYLIKEYQVSDGAADAVFLIAGITMSGFACWLHWDQVGQLFR